MIGVLTYFLGFQIEQTKKGISINKERYFKDLLRKYDKFGSSVNTPIVPPNMLGPDLNGKAVNESQYKGMSGSLMNLTASRPDIQFSTGLYARHQANIRNPTLVLLREFLVTTDTSGQIKILLPKTTEEIVVRERERKARTTLLMAIPEDHIAKFHKMTDAKEMWNAIKSRFGGNDESKKMQKYILKQQFEGFTVSNTDGIHKGYERFQSLLSQLEIHRAGVSAEDANQEWTVSVLMTCTTI
ncbi:hypothetical protein Tco_0936411 [Tanacetum coccineum]